MFTIYYANTRNDPKNCRYPNRLADLSDEALKEAFSHDYVCAEYKGNYRNASNFIRSNCLAFDVDNDHSDDPADWLTPDDLRDPFKGVEMIIHFSRSHMKAKNGRLARPKFHVLFPIEECTSSEQYAAMKQKVYEYFPYFDAQALDSARFFFGTENPEIECYEGTLLNELLPMDNLDSAEEHAVPVKKPDETKVFTSVIPQGQRNTTMYSIAVKVLKRFGDTEKATDLFLAESERCVPPLDSEELAGIWNSALKFFQRKIATDPEEEDRDGPGIRFAGSIRE